MSWDTVRFGDLYDCRIKKWINKTKQGKRFRLQNDQHGELFANDRIYDIPMELVPLKESEKINAKVECGDLLFARQSLVLEGSWQM